MICTSTKNTARTTALAAMLSLAAAGSLAPAEAGWKRKQQKPVEPEVQQTLAGAPVMAVASIRGQNISLYDAYGNAIRSKISSGRTGYETPPGIYSVLQKNRDHRSNLYDAEMPYMQRITWTGVALHEGQIPGYPASHGCVRLPGKYAEQIFPLTKVGMRVILSKDDVAPAPISHPLLLQPQPVATREVLTNTSYGDDALPQPGRSVFQPTLTSWPARQAELDELADAAAAKISLAEDAKMKAGDLKREMDLKNAARAKTLKAHVYAEKMKKGADARLAGIEKSLAKAKKPSAIADWEKAKTKATFAVAEAQKKLEAAAQKLSVVGAPFEAAKKEWEAAEAERVSLETAALEAQRKTLPVSIFISRKTQRLYVRQGHEAVFDIPVTIAEPDKPIGTHVFTAVDYANGGNSLKWTAVSLTQRPAWQMQTAALADKKSRRDVPADPMPTDAAAAGAALDRITIPKEVLEKLSASAWTGSSIIVSDEEAHKETGKATDFIVVMSGEPQGALKKRPKPAPQFYSPYGYGYDAGFTVTYGPRGQTIYRLKPQKKSLFSFW